jgi:hypothetical protein
MAFFQDVINHPLEASVAFSFALTLVLALRWPKAEERLQRRD